VQVVLLNQDDLVYLVCQSAGFTGECVYICKCSR
jgi:hypothetical protein